MANRYSKLIAAIFATHYREGSRELPFSRDELVKAAKRLGIQLPKNLGDVIYSFRFRNDLPESILRTCDEGRTWVIQGAGKGRYKFKQVKEVRIEPGTDVPKLDIPDATPQIIERYAMSDEQALLAKVRYNRLIDLFTGTVCYSLQNHLRTAVKDIGQIEVDELYVGIDGKGGKFILPIQAKTARDMIGVTQVTQDVAFCREKFPDLKCKPIAVQLIGSNDIAMFAVELVDDEPVIVEERHYRLIRPVLKT
jgi:hypothetical protein